MSDEPTERDVEAILQEHIWVGDVTHRAECDCNWRAPSGNGLDGKREHAAHVAARLAERIAQARREGAAEALEKIASDPEVIKKVKWRIDHYGPLDAEPFQFSRYESVAHAALSVLGDRAAALRGDA